MPRKFTDAKALLADLLDRYEGGTASPIGYPDYPAFASVLAADAFMKEIRRTEEAGAVSVAMGKGNRRDQIAHVRLEAPEPLYRLLEREPIGTLAGSAHAQLTEGLELHEELKAAASEVLSTWSRGKAWGGLFPADVGKLRLSFALAQGILDGRHVGADYRTFSRRIAGDSKALERSEGIVARLVGRMLELPPGAKPREALRTLGLEKFAPPLLIAGRVDLVGADMKGAPLSYLGIAPNEADRILFRDVPAYLLTIENFASFSRHIAEADPEREGVTIYVGGYPSLATQRALGILTSKLSDQIPIYHWSDIDPDGTWIFRTIERAMGRTLRPHLMSPEIAEQFGKPSVVGAGLKKASPDSGIFALSEYLSSPDAKTLEQEELDPRIPRG